jgi:hypothetical protein
MAVVVAVPATERERAAANGLIASASGMGWRLDFARAVEIARLVDEEDEEVPT